MSYILDALKKSEIERNQNDGVSLLNYPSQNQLAGIPIWLIVMVTVAVNISALVIWTYWPTSITEPQPGVALHDTHPSSQRETVLAEPTVKPVVENAEVKTEPPARPQRNQDYPDSITPFSALSRAERDAFPQVEFSTHIYSDDPEYRVLIANGLRLTEGGMLSDTVKLITISENGAVFLHANRLVEIPVLQEWRIQ